MILATSSLEAFVATATVIGYFLLAITAGNLVLFIVWLVCDHISGGLMPARRANNVRPDSHIPPRGCRSDNVVYLRIERERRAVGPANHHHRRSRREYDR